MFGTILLSAVTLMHIYVFWRVSSIPFIKNNLPKKNLIGIGILLWTGFVLGRVFGHGEAGILAIMLEMFGMNWMGTLFLIFIPLLAVDLLTGFGLLLSRTVPSLRGLAFLAGGLLSVVAHVQGLRPPVVQNYDVYLSNLPIEMDGKELVAISDLHIGSLLGKKWLEARISQIQEQQPDIIVLLGDILEGHGHSQEEIDPILRRLSAPMGVWAVSGNHESYGRYDQNRETLNGPGFKTLNNSWVELHPGIVLAGVEDLTSQNRSGKKNDVLSEALTNRPPGTTILLSHSPLEYDKAAKAGVNLMLSGHTHGGQIWPFGYIVQQRYPLLEGRYDIDGMTVIVCRGTGTWGPRMRLWRPGEILRVILHRATVDGA